MSVSRNIATFVNLIVTCVALGVMSTALATALAPIVLDLNVTVAQGQWLTSGYALVLAVVTPAGAYLTQRFKRGKLYLVAVGAYALGSVVCAVSPGFNVLMAGRVVQASANAVIANLTQVTILQLFPKEQRGRYMGWFGLSQGAAVVLGPSAGGVLTDVLGWRSLFWLIGGLCLVSALAATRTMRDFRDALGEAPAGFDLLSFVASGVAFGGMTLGLGNLASLGKAAASNSAAGAAAGAAGAAGLGAALVGVVLPLALAAMAGVWFWRRQLFSEKPFLKVQLLHIKSFRLAVLASMVLYLVMNGSTTLLPLYAQMGAGASAAVSGLVVLPGALAMALVSPAAGRVYDKFGIKLLLGIGGAALALGNAGMLFVGSGTPLWVVAALNVVRCVAIGCMQMPLATWGNADVEPFEMPHASALLTALRNVAGALGVCLFVGIFDALVSLAGTELGVQVAYAAMAVCSLTLPVFGMIVKVKA